MNGAIVLAAGDIEVGHHRTATIGGLTFNVDTIYSSIIAGLIVFGLGFYMARRAQSGRPSKLQLLWETIVGAVRAQVESAMGPVAPFVVPTPTVSMCTPASAATPAASAASGPAVFSPSENRTIVAEPQ